MEGWVSSDTPKADHNSRMTGSGGVGKGGRGVVPMGRGGLNNDVSRTCFALL